MNNQEIAKILYEISEYLAMDDIPFKPRAYEKAAAVIGALDQEVSEIKNLKSIDSVGEGIAKVIKELLKDGKTKIYEDLKKKTPVNLSELTSVGGLGPKMIKKLYLHLKIKNLKDLEKAVKAGKVHDLEDFGLKTEHNILRSIEFVKKSGRRFLLGHVLPEARKIEKRIKEVQGVKKAVLAGSIRRMKETVGDGDLLVCADKKINNVFVNMPEVIHVYSSGSTKSSVRLRNNMDFDLRVVPEKSFGAALQYFTGSKSHNIKLRKIAMKKGLKLNEYGLFKGKESIAKTEQDIYKKLGFEYIEPELREDTGELEKKLPKLVKSLKGDLQMHSTWSDGVNSIKEMAQVAKAMGLEYIAITDHTKNLKIANGMDEKGFLKQAKEIDKIKDFKVLKGAEVDILKDGRLDLKDEALKKLDIVGISVHLNTKMSKKEMTERIIKAMKNPYAHILFHPTGRLINQRPAYEVDIEKIFRAAKQTKTISFCKIYY